MTSAVAPPAGAWIETVNATYIDAGSITSLPLRERGLKPVHCFVTRISPQSLPLRERGLKHFAPTEIPALRMSLPLRERGLKQ